MPTLDELRRRGTAALLSALGPLGMVRFLQQFDSGQGDYTRDRDAWLGSPSVRELAARIEAQRQRP
jgi:hypothetical protein